MPDALDPVWSIDARVMLRPARAFLELAKVPGAGGWRVAWRRPAFVAAALGTGISLVVGSTLTLRLALPAMLAWSFIPLTEILALSVVTSTRRKGVPLSFFVDRFFAGHAPWTLLMIAIAAVLSVAPHWMSWQIVTGPCVWMAAVVVAWSAYVDYCFFRFVFGASLRRAIGDVALLRVLTWSVGLWVIAGQARAPWAAAAELANSFAEVVQR